MKHYLREWRIHRAMTQEELAALIGTNASVISLLEDSKRRLSDRWLSRLAPALRTSRGAILDCEPHSIEASIAELCASVSEASKDQVLAILRTFTAKTSARRSKD